ncbi:glycine-rich domain-containing protein [Micromonospora aurantiaca (nom. illeg.)]|uniref:glycine-rich domain-containing protein n=1 Tax=Micromonospora aurantiaca (nom. illeg.) TaxID=47850 RepID=UPI0033E0CFD0
MAINADWLRIIDELISRKLERLTASGTVVERRTTEVMVLFDGSAVAVPVKGSSSAAVAAGDRVGLAKFGTDWTVIANFSAAPIPQQKLFDTAGATTWTKPPGARRFLVEVQAGGGGGGGSLNAVSGQHSKGGGGGGGGYARKWFNAVDLPDEVPLTVGAAGNRSNGNPGGSGGTSSFGSPVLLSASGGLGGQVSGVSSATWGALGGAGGATFAGDPDLAVAGDAGGLGVGGGAIGSGGEGGGSFLGGGGVGTVQGATVASTDGVNGQAYGGGGGGAQTNTTGGAAMGGLGGRGCVIVTAHF